MKGKVSVGLNADRCRNCWRVVCDSCIGTVWARTMVPKMYTRDSDAHRMRVCKTCHCAMEMFRKALLLGRVEEAMAAYGTGCVNVDTPYTIYHGELPVHCAAAGGNVVLLSWLVDELGCSLFADGDLKKPLRDLRNLSVLGAAAVNAQVQTMRYLVNTKRCSLFEITHLPTMKKALEACLHVAPEAKDGERSSYVDRGGSIEVSGVFGAASAFDDEDDCCIVCFDNEVACTLVPCGHHCCCRDCAGRLTHCPVCRARITEMIKAIPV
ncbi:unnamed protein product [Laminaria digitata]